VAPVPLLWVLPLAAYLLSFVVTFESDRFYRRPAVLPAFAVALALLAWRAHEPLRDDRPLLEVGSALVALFLCAVTCHGELARLRPARRYLTGFYLWLALGGVLGGAFVALLAPLAF